MDEVIDNTDPKSGWRSAAYDEAENRLHVQKAVMALDNAVDSYIRKLVDS
jgi:ornithine carbamoyltransferase